MALVGLALFAEGPAPAPAQPSGGTLQPTEPLRIVGSSTRFEGIDATFAILPFARPMGNNAEGYSPNVDKVGGGVLPARWTLPVEIRWDFGDGSPPVSTGERVTVAHRYEEQGTYTVRVTAVAADGFEARGEHQIEITNRKPSVVRVAAAPAIGVAGGLDFTATAQDTPADALTYHWDFGDGETAEGEDLWEIRHVYGDPGDFTVTLTVTDDEGDLETATEEVQVRGAVEAGSPPEPVDPGGEPEAVLDGLRGRVAGAISADLDAEVRSMRGIFLSPISSGACRFTFMAWDDRLLAYALVLVDFRQLPPEGGRYHFVSPQVTLVFEDDAEAYVFNKRQGLGAGGIAGIGGRLGDLAEIFGADGADERAEEWRRRMRDEVGVDPRARKPGEAVPIPAVSPFGLDEPARLGDAMGTFDLTYLPGRHARGTLNVLLESSETGPLGGRPVALENVSFALDLEAAKRDGMFNARGCHDGTFEIDERSPEPHSRHVRRRTPVNVSFDRRVDPTSVTEDTFKVAYPDPQGQWVPAEGRLLRRDFSATFVPDEPLRPGVRYTARVKVGEEGVKALDGSLLEDTEGGGWQSWDFTTQIDFSPEGGLAAQQLACHLFQSVRDPRLIAGKPALARVYASWPEPAGVLGEAQVREFDARVILTDRRGDELASGPMTFVRPDLWASSGISLAAAEHTAQIYGFTPTRVLELPLRIRLEVPTEPGKLSRHRYPAWTCPAELWDREPKVTVAYFAIPVFRWADEEAFNAASLALQDIISRAKEYGEQLFPVAKLQQSAVVSRLPPEGEIPSSPVVEKDGQTKAWHPADYNGWWHRFMLGWTDADIVVGFLPHEPTSGGNTKRVGNRAVIIITAGESPGKRPTYVNGLVHEIGHALSLEHLPYTDSAEEIADLKAVRDSGLQVRFQGIEGFRLIPNGNSGWNKSSTEGNQQDESLFPLMYPVTVHPDKAFISHHHYLEMQRRLEELGK